MIKALDIKKFGSYIDFDWKKDIGNYDTNDATAKFSEINIIYGRNYSGKTTLSRILNSLEKKKIHVDYLDSEFDVIMNDGSKISSNNLENNFNIKIYNSDFVKENLKWFYDKDCAIKPFAILGEKNIEIQDKIKQLEIELEEQELKLNKINQEYNQQDELVKQLNSQLQNKLTDEARKIKVNTLMYNEVNYDKSKLLRSFNTFKEPFTFLTDGEKVVLEKEIQESPKEEIILLKKINIIQEDKIKEINDLLQYELKINEPIQELLNDSYLEKWVREGKDLHKSRKKCVFCGGDLTDKIWEKINNHFNNESEKLIQKININLETLNSLEKDLDNYQAIDPNKIIITFNDEIKSEIIEFENSRNNLKKYYQKIKNNLNLKKDQINQKIELLFFEANNINNIIDRINEILEKHNNYCLNIETRKKEARKKLLINEEKIIFSKLDYKNSSLSINQEKISLENLNQEKNNILKRKENIISRKLELESSLKNETKSCDLINKYLNEYFGRKDLHLKIKDLNDISSFSIYRDNSLAQNLSEGECSLISFCYFLATISDFKDDTTLILWIDDPISSLDTNQIFFTFGILDSIVSNYQYKQLFISTHNLDFLKYLKRLKSINSRKISYFLVERRAKKENYTSKLLKMPKYLKEYTTEFHFLFEQIYNISTKNDEELLNTYTQIFNIPNNIRKFLEYYLFYKYPNTNSPLENLKKIFTTEEYSSINRLINENSHLVFIDRGWKPIDIPEIQRICNIILIKLEKLDEEQFNALKEAIK